MDQVNLLKVTQEHSVCTPPQITESEFVQPVEEIFKLSTLVGQNLAVSLLKGAITCNRIAPAYLFTGPDGVGKSLAAKCLLSEALSIDDLANHPDLLWVKPTYLHHGKLLNESELVIAGVQRKSPSLLRIEQIREITQFLSRSPLNAPFKAVVVQDADKMQLISANALLKTLEETTTGTIILLSSQPQRLLPTITSRCQIIPFRKLTHAEMKAVFERIGQVENLNNPMVMTLAAGSPGQAIAHHYQLQSVPRSLLKQLSTPPTSPLIALNIAKEIEATLEFHQQLWLLDYLQHCWRKFLNNSDWLSKLEEAKNSLFKASCRLVWDVLLLPE
ncbi:MAG: AAA family ATPase [Pelatocladus maniniholoensis HA4357-MV3]|jgi:DNA polymerase-3 subunit delta'|uniref:AAA family ATPase n=1 Tax=Pelatocladus maniniholoensis HA4357-MV3 TaxID=1117104 RepID=A0A9E3HAL9_9NOST|nr:AAA family ATPase [Pelatocladus maniniholoensis HA4357-MV3]